LDIFPDALTDDSADGWTGKTWTSTETFYKNIKILIDKYKHQCINVYIIKPGNLVCSSITIE